MSLEIGEITLYSDSFISGCWQWQGIGFLTLGCTAERNAAMKGATN